MSADLSKTAEIAGFIGACLVDADTGLMLTSQGGGGLDLESAAALNAQVVSAQIQVIKAMSLQDNIEDLLITLGKQIHLIRPLSARDGVFIYVILDRKLANLGMARLQVKNIEAGIKFG
jgi:predicted regulator of Ras-like GTPase activity (Roadblock/LC7/MglB family)